MILEANQQQNYFNMKTEIKFSKYNNNEFTIEELKPLEQFIIHQLKDYERVPGVGLIFNKVVFMISSIGFDVNEGKKIINVDQITTLKKSVIEKPNILDIQKVN